MHRIRNRYTVGEHVDFTDVWYEDDVLRTEPTLDVTEEQDPTLGDNYRIRVRKPHRVILTHGNERSRHYAAETLEHLIIHDDLDYGLYEDGPRFDMRGIIEGFYGEPWTHADRLDVMSFLEQHHMNTYMYAPKDDPYHRHKWREPYPADAFAQLRELIDAALAHDVDFYFSISPGNDFNYTKEDDFVALFEKIDAVRSCGVRHFCLLLDDIDYQLNAADKAAFQTPGQAHAYITNRLHEHLRKHDEQTVLVMCPTEYHQNVDTPYRNDLKQHMNPDVLVFWTGYNTVAEYIPNVDGERVRDYFGHELVLWDNYPVNDMATDMLFLGPLTGRGDQLDRTHTGMVSNPMVQWSLSKIPIITMSDYMWDPSGYDPEQSFAEAIRDFAGEESFVLPLERVVSHFRHTILEYYQDPQLESHVQDRNIDGLVAYYEQLIDDIRTLDAFPDPRFREQFQPWWERIVFDHDLLKAMQADDTAGVARMLSEVPDKQHTTGGNYAVKYAKAIGLYDGPLYPHQRKNFWE